jgi:phage gpG-like protein
MAGAHNTISIAIDDAEVKQTLRQMLARLQNPSPVMRDIGEYMLRSTDERFRREVAPDGKPWAPLSEVTLLRRLTGTKKDPKKGLLSKRKTTAGGRTLTKKGAKVLAAAKILRDSGVLQDTIRYQLKDGGRAVAVGTNRIYAAAQQFGMKRGYAGSDRHGRPIPWGDIPPRPFLGIAAADREEILEILRRALEQSL